MRVKITKTMVDRLQPGEVVSDTDLNGFRVRAGVHKVYSIQKRIGNKVVTRTIGKHGVFTPDTARKEAQRILLQLSQGIDPHAAERKAAVLSSLTFGSLVDLYEAKHKNQHTLNDIKRVRSKLSDWLRLPANDISRSMVQARFAALCQSGETQAALVMRYVRAIYNSGISEYRDDKTGESAVVQNPTKVLTEKKILKATRRRSSFLKPIELRKWFQGMCVARAEFPDVCDYLVATMLLGCRRSEAARLKWIDVDLDHGVVVFRDTKNKSDHHLPLGVYLTDLFKRRKAINAQSNDFVFPAGSRIGCVTEPRPALDKIAEISGVKIVVGDLRRTFATVADGLDFSPYSIKRLMNHKTNAGNDVTLGYIGIDYERQRKRMQEIEDFILKAAGVIDTPIIQLSIVTAANK